MQKNQANKIGAVGKKLQILITLDRSLLSEG